MLFTKLLYVNGGGGQVVCMYLSEGNPLHYGLWTDPDCALCWWEEVSLLVGLWLWEVWLGKSDGIGCIHTAKLPWEEEVDLPYKVACVEMRLRNFFLQSLFSIPGEN